MRIDVFDLLVAALQLLEGLNHRLGHPFVSVLRTADENEFLARGDALVAIFIVESDAEDATDLRLPLFAAWACWNLCSPRHRGWVRRGFKRVFHNGLSITASATMSANASLCRIRSFLQAREFQHREKGRDQPAQRHSLMETAGKIRTIVPSACAPAAIPSDRRRSPTSS